ncbi:MAG: hypothetical protein ACRDD2_12785 [Sarcina sp.]
MQIIFYLLTVVIGAVVIFGAYALLTRFVFNKVSVNKWILLAAAVIILLIGFFLIRITWLQIIFEAIGIILLFWFFDVYKNGNPKIKKEKKIVIKAKAKPNRVKNHKIDTDKK